MFAGMLPCLALHGLKLCKICISFRSRSDLVLDADHALDFYLISLFRRASRFIVFSTKMAPECLCLVRLKMPLLMWETDFLPLLVLTRQECSTSKSQYW